MTEQPLRRPTVAIIGSHPRTRDQFDFDREDCSIWVFNEAMAQEWCTRADAVFQLHKPVVFRSATNRNDPKHYEWLQSHNTPEIIMQEQYPDVPNSSRYPIEDVLALAPGFGYLTSSVAYAIALAIVREYKRIELYGAEMETNTEYGHQRQGMAFWIGVAVGRGIEVEHVSPTFWNAPLYGYEGDVRVDMSHYEGRIEALRDQRDKIQQAHDQQTEQINQVVNAFIKDYKADQSRLDDIVVAVAQSAHDFGVMDGALQVNEQYLERCKIMLEESGTYLIVRQELEGKARAGADERDEQLRNVHVRADRLQQARKKLRTNSNQDIRAGLAGDFSKKLADYIKVCTLTGIGSGCFQENMLLLQTYDKLLGSQGVDEVEVVTDPHSAQMKQDVAVLEGELEDLSNHW
jgi:hypothetical protein